MCVGTIAEESHSYFPGVISPPYLYVTISGDMGWPLGESIIYIRGGLWASPLYILGVAFGRVHYIY
jgi:hypothetical protein